MIRLPVTKLKQGMIIAQSIYNQRGASYLVKGRPITSSYIRALRRLGIPTVTVTSADPNFQLMPPEDIIQESTRIDAIETVCDTFDTVKKTGQMDTHALQGISEGIIFDIIERKENLVQLTDIRLHDTYTFAHSVNVAVLSAMLGLLCHYTKKELLLLTLGGLLHDLGKIDVPIDILTKRTRLREDEFNLIKQHPDNGAKRIREMDIALPSPAILAAIASEHHEHIDGTGYPRRLDENHIHRFARIVAIADVYDALTSERPYKKAYTPNIAYNMMVHINQGQFDTELLQLFFNNVAIYPTGTVLKTRYGYGIVRDCIFGKTATPTIILFADSDGRVLPIPRTVDLATDPAGNQAIKMVLNDQELRHFIQEVHIDPAIFLPQ